MSLKKFIPTVIAIALAGFVAVAISMIGVRTIETKSRSDVERVLSLNGNEWANVEVDGLQVILHGEAPDEAARFRALSTAGAVVDASRLIDVMDVADRDAIAPPRFSIEILRNDDGVFLIGLIPTSMDRESTVAGIVDIVGAAGVTDLMETADYPIPKGWDQSIEYGMGALAMLPRTKISIMADRVEIKAISDSATEKRNLETTLSRRAPKDLTVAIEITAPRPVITPFTLRFLIDGDGARFDACSTDTEDGRERILIAAAKVGLEGKSNCTIGLGKPSPTWDDAVIIGITKLREIGGGSITFSDADVTLVALDTTTQATFDQVIGELEAEMPDAFSVHSVLPPPPLPEGSEEVIVVPEFVATLSPEGLLQLRGRATSERSRVAIESFAQAQFGSENVNGTMRLDIDLPKGWSTRLLASLEALAHLNNGSVLMRPEIVEIKGITGDPKARSEISRLLSEKLGAAQDFRISVKYERKLDPVLDLPDAKECVKRINLILSVRQITFAPSSGDIDDVARDTIENIAKVMKDCSEFPMEVGGHTDSQGREVMNQALSQTRANAVVNALLARRVLTSNLTAKGYGESAPVADNDTEKGRELNRRIEFRLLEVTETADAPETDQTESPDEQN